jgi:hypothetical protein
MSGYSRVSDRLNEGAGDGRTVESPRDLHLKVVGKRGVEASRLCERLAFGDQRAVRRRLPRPEPAAIYRHKRGLQTWAMRRWRHVEIEDGVDCIGGFGAG